MGMVKDSPFDVLEASLASLEYIGRAWEREFTRTRDWENIEDLLWLVQRLREVLGRK